MWPRESPRLPACQSGTGYTLLTEQGVRALKVARLCQQTGVTRGSFYWHFDDMDSYRAALVESWNAFLEKDRQSQAELDSLPPRERLSAMMIALLSPQHWMLERAMREWARAPTRSPPPTSGRPIDA